MGAPDQDVCFRKSSLTPLTLGYAPDSPLPENLRGNPSYSRVRLIASRTSFDMAASDWDGSSLRTYCKPACLKRQVQSAMSSGFSPNIFVNSTVSSRPSGCRSNHACRRATEATRRLRPSLPMRVSKPGAISTVSEAAARDRRKQGHAKSAVSPRLAVCRCSAPDR